MNKGKISLSTRIEVELSLGRCLFVFLYGWEGEWPLWKVNKGKISLSTRIEVELSLGRCLLCFYMGGKANGHFGPLIQKTSSSLSFQQPSICEVVHLTLNLSKLHPVIACKYYHLLN